MKTLNSSTIVSWLSALIICCLALPVKFSVSFIYLFAGMALFLIIKEKRISLKNEFVVLMILLAGLQLAHVFIDSNQTTATFELEKKLSWFFLPLLWYNLPFKNNREFVDKTLRLIGLGIGVFGWGLILFTLYRYFQIGSAHVFFYHDLVSIWDGNAIYYSLLFFISILLLLNELKQKNNLVLVVVLTNILLILALSSKLFALALIVLLTYQLIKLKKPLILLFVFVGLIGSQFLLKENSVVSRFNEMNLSSFFDLKKKITPVTEFDGFTIRKELWNIGLEILEENPDKIWLGIGPGDTQDLINKKLIERDFYIGDGTPDDIGYLNYNLHNQYLQTFIELGVIGILFLGGIFYYLISLGIRNKNASLISINLLFLFAFLTESFLSRQMGVISFVGMNSLFIFKEKYLPINSFSMSIKRLFDLVFSSFVILFILSWSLPIMCLIVFLDTKSFPLFVQLRVGKNQENFKCFKLRSMIKNTDADLLAAQENDARITKIGGFLRKYAIDELPQFFNVFLGQMSTVGPRPLMVNEEIEFNQLIPNFSKRLISKPGITGLSQSFGYKGMVEGLVDIKIRMKLDMLYAEKQSLWLDVKLIMNTLKYIFAQIGIQ